MGKLSHAQESGVCLPWDSREFLFSCQVQLGQIVPVALNWEFSRILRFLAMVAKPRAHLEARRNRRTLIVLCDVSEDVPWRAVQQIADSG